MIFSLSPSVYQVIVESIVLFCSLLFPLAKYRRLYKEDRNTLTQKSRTLCKLPFAIEIATNGYNQLLHTTSQGYSCLAITDDEFYKTFTSSSLKLKNGTGNLHWKPLIFV